MADWRFYSDCVAGKWDPPGKGMSPSGKGPKNVDACTDAALEDGLALLDSVLGPIINDLIVYAIDNGSDALFQVLVSAGLPEAVAGAITGAVAAGAAYASEEALEELGMTNALAAYRAASVNPTELGFDYGPGSVHWRHMGGALGVKNPAASSLEPLYTVLVPLDEAAKAAAAAASPGTGIHPKHRQAAAVLLKFIGDKMASALPAGQAEADVMAAAAVASAPGTAGGFGYGGVNVAPLPTELKIQAQRWQTEPARIAAYPAEPGNAALFALAAALAGPAAAAALEALAGLPAIAGPMASLLVPTTEGGPASSESTAAWSPPTEAALEFYQAAWAEAQRQAERHDGPSANERFQRALASAREAAAAGRGAAGVGKYPVWHAGRAAADKREKEVKQEKATVAAASAVGIGALLWLLR